jgi:hypothetical protein
MTRPRLPWDPYRLVRRYRRVLICPRCRHPRSFLVTVRFGGTWIECKTCGGGWPADV